MKAYESKWKYKKEEIRISQIESKSQTFLKAILEYILDKHYYCRIIKILN